MQFRFLAAALLLAIPAAAQTVDDPAINAFVASHAAVTHINKIARWEDPICPTLTGLPAGFTKFILARVKTIATAAGVPVAADGCKANIGIVFTTQPQALADGMRKTNPVMLGYFDNTSQADQMAKVTHPIQAWYVTASVDLHGKPQIDTRYAHANSQNYSATESTGSHLGDGQRSVLYQVSIVADPSKLADHEIGGLADNIAMLALAQPATVDECSQLPSVLNLTTAGCHADAPITALTVNDSAYLHGLYHGLLGVTLRAQQDGIAFGMKEKLAGR
jgi:hypothetical protein